MMTVVKDKDPIWDTDDFDVVLVGTSVYNQLNGGFQSKMRYKYPLIDEENRKTKYADYSKMGTRITVGKEPSISLLYISGNYKTLSTTLNYEALEKCLQTANAEFKGKKVVTTVLGSTRFDGRGDKEKCLKIIEENTSDLDLTVYDYEQKTRKEEVDEQIKYLSFLRHTNQEKYQQLKSVFDLYLKKLYLNG